jgi:hypothetical protein
MVEASPRPVNKPEPKGFAAMVFGLNFMESLAKLAKNKVGVAPKETRS